MKKRRGITFVLLGCLISISGCGVKDREFSSIEDLRDAFVKAGGQCWEWKKNNPRKSNFKSQKGNATCDSKTFLVLFSDGVSSKDEALGFANTLRGMNFEVSLLVGKNWMINSDQVTKVSAQLGGTLITR